MDKFVLSSIAFLFLVASVIAIISTFKGKGSRGSYKPKGKWMDGPNGKFV